MATLNHPVTFTLKVTVTGIADAPTNKGNYGMRGATVEILDASIDVDNIGAFVPGNGNNSNILMFFAPDGVKRPTAPAAVTLPKAKAKAKAAVTLPKAKAKAPAQAEPDLQAMIAAEIAKAFAAMQK